MMSAPRPSSANVSSATVPANRSRPSIVVTLSASASVRRSCIDMRRPKATMMSVEIVM